MICTVCKSGELNEGKVTVTLQREGSIIIVKNVPAEECENCGDYVLSESVTDKIMKQAESAVTNKAEVEILQYAA